MINVKMNQLQIPIDYQVLDNGITLINIENDAADLVAGRIFVKGAGARVVQPDRAGLSHLVAAVITKGTTNLSALEIVQQVESVGAGLGADTASDYFVVKLKTVTADFAAIFNLAAEIVRSPSFPSHEIELETNLTRQAIRAQTEQPFNLAFKNLREAMYPNHPYGVSVLGTETSISNITRGDLQQYHRDYFRPENLVISLSGRIKTADAVKLVEAAFGDWQPQKTQVNTPTFPPLTVQPTYVKDYQDTQQSIVMIGYLAPGVSDPDYPTLKLISSYLGNGLSSRLFVELREKRGLAYDVSAFYPTRLDQAQFVAYIGTAPVNTATALEGLQTEVERLADIGLTEAELQTAKNKLLGQYALSKQTNAEIAQIYGWYETIGLGIDYDSQFQQQISDVTLTQIQTAANKYLLQPYVSLVGPAPILDAVSV